MQERFEQLMQEHRPLVRRTARRLGGAAGVDAADDIEQDVFLFDGTVADNIRYADPAADDARVERAARAASAHEFIAALPQGYATAIGERGVRLSGGQRQRIAIARALLADPRILILDEATSNLDTESERAIQEALQGLMRDRTSFVIAHRLSTIMHADRIVVLKDGRIAEMGTHDELMERSGQYRQMVLVQTAPPAAPPRFGQLRQAPIRPDPGGGAPRHRRSGPQPTAGRGDRRRADHLA